MVLLWFESISGSIVEQVGLRNGREISAQGVRDLPMDADALTGYVIVHAGSLEEAQALAQNNPFITSIRVYELMTM